MPHEKQLGGDTVILDKKTPIKMTIGIAASTILATVTLVWQGSQMLNRLDTWHKDELERYKETWHIEDMLEYNHQAIALTTNHQLPDVGEVLRVSRSQQIQQKEMQ